MRAWLRTAIYFAAAVIITAALTVAVTIRTVNKKSEDKVTLTTEEYGALSEFAALNELLDIIGDDALNAAPERDRLLDGAARGMLQELDDPYAQYYTAEEYEAYLTRINGSYNGVGMLIGQPTQAGAEVLDVYKGYSAEKAGILVGDVITSVNGANVSGMQIDELAALIDGELGSKTNVKLLRGAVEYEFELESVAINIERVQSALFKEYTGYIRVDMFTGNCVDEFKAALNDLTERGMRSLVIDLRNNPGGSLESVVSIADMLLGEGVIVSVRGNHQEQEQVYKAAGSGVSVPIAVIVNENSASASEILAAALRDNGAGVVVGMKTYGKGVVQTTQMLQANGGWIKLTTDAYYTPAGANIDGEGLMPDVEIDLPEDMKSVAIDAVEQEDDAQLWAALDYVREAASEMQ